MGRKKKLVPIPLADIDKAATEDAAYVHAKDLEEYLKKANADTQEILLTGSVADLTQLSWALYEKFKKGQLKTHFEDDKEIEQFYKLKSQELIIKLMGFLDMASSHILDTQKLSRANIREITLAMNAVSTMLNNIMDKPSMKVDHQHTHKLAKDSEELNRRVQENKEKLAAIDAEFEEIEKDDDIVDI